MLLEYFDRIHHDHATDLKAANQLTAKFVEVFSNILDDELRGPWQEVSIYDFVRTRMAEASITVLCGSRIFAVSPDVVEFWEWNDVFLKLSYGFPRTVFRTGYEIRDKLHASTRRWLADAWARYDWSAPNVDWEENFGSRLLRTRENEFKETIGSNLDSRASSEMGLLLALNGNAIPATGWTFLSLLRLPDLFKRVHSGVSQVANIDKSSSKLTLDIPSLMSLPWLLAVYMEIPRLRVHFSVTREIIEDIEIDGHILKAGHLIMASTYIAHTLDPAWISSRYPVRDFYPERFLIFDEKASVVKFSTGEAGGKMFPYGSGIFRCPGRNFAKQEIMAAIAFMLLTFDFEALGYVKMDGSPSDRGPRLYERFAGAGVTPPDRDMRVRLRRR